MGNCAVMGLKKMFLTAAIGLLRLVSAGAREGQLLRIGIGDEAAEAVVVARAFVRAAPRHTSEVSPLRPSSAVE